MSHKSTLRNDDLLEILAKEIQIDSLEFGDFGVESLGRMVDGNFEEVYTSRLVQAFLGSIQTYILLSGVMNVGGRFDRSFSLALRMGFTLAYLDGFGGLFRP